MARAARPGRLPPSVFQSLMGARTHSQYEECVALLELHQAALLDTANHAVRARGRGGVASRGQGRRRPAAGDVLAISERAVVHLRQTWSDGRGHTERERETHTKRETERHVHTHVHLERETEMHTYTDIHTHICYTHTLAYVREEGGTATARTHC
jgi:hypothetical protein